jgi:hypothetical protein
MMPNRERPSNEIIDSDYLLDKWLMERNLEEQKEAMGLRSQKTVGKGKDRESYSENIIGSHGTY